MRRIASRARLLLAMAGVGFAAGGCNWSASHASNADIVVVSSTNVWGDIAATVGGTHVQVTSFISSPAQDPHSFESNSRSVLAVAQADVVIENGGGYDDFMGRLLDASKASPTVLDAVAISGVSAADGDTVNEHVWYDLPTVEKVSARIAAAFVKADPGHAGDYRNNVRVFTDSLDALIAREATMRRSLAGVGVGVTEPVPLSMLEAIGADNVTPEQFSAAVEEGNDVAVSVLNETLTLYSDHRVAALVYNEQTSGPVTEQVKQAAVDAGIPVVPVTETLPDGVHYLTWMGENLDALDKALSTP